MARGPSGTIYTTADLAAATSAPAQGLAKILQRLAASGIVVGLRGSGGGVVLTRPPESISVGEVVEALECGQGKRSDGRRGGEPRFAALARLEASLADDFLARLQRTTLASLTDPPEARRPIPSASPLPKE